MRDSNIEKALRENSRGQVFCDYESAVLRNRELFLKNDVKATSEYIYPNQKEDASRICNTFHDSSIRVISVVKRTKLGNDGLMIEIAKIMSTHPDDNFVIHKDNILFITGMSNISWEEDMKEKIPSCWKDSVYHHGKLQKLKNKLKNIKNAVIIIDEIDTGDGEQQRLDTKLKESGILDMTYMEENNIRFVCVSATIINELHELYKWGNKHYTYHMTIPESYIGHKEFVELGIIKEYYSIKSDETAEKWVKEDIIQNYGTDFRVHIIRTDAKNTGYIHNACIRNSVRFENHTSEDRISNEDLSNIFKNVTEHVVIAIKGFYRRANLIPTTWKLKIGATHERYTKKHDTNVQIQGLPGRMTGHWRLDILNGHKTGPHRTSIAAMNEYEEFCKNPFGKIKYSTISKKIFLNPKNIQNLEVIEADNEREAVGFRVYDNETVVKDVCKRLGYSYRTTKDNSNGFKETSLNRIKEVVSLTDAISKVQTAYGTNNGEKTWRTYYPCYVDTENKETLRFVVIIRPDTDINKITEVDTMYPSV